MPFNNLENSSEKCNLCEFNNNYKINLRTKLKSENEYEENLKESVNFKSDCNLNINLRTKLKSEVLHEIRKPKLKPDVDRHLLIQIRNARERSRIYEINKAFFRLSQAVPYTVGRNKRISKVKTLQKALQYIHELEKQLYNEITVDDHSDINSDH